MDICCDYLMQIVMGSVKDYISNITNFIDMARLIDKNATRNKTDIDQLKSAILKANYEVDFGLLPAQLINPTTHNPEAPFAKPTTTVNSHLIGSSWQQSQSNKKNDSSSKRLKLKDYLHLHSIEKKSRNRPSTGSSFYESDACLKGDNGEDRSIRQTKTKSRQFASIQLSVNQQSRYMQIFKGQINNQIEQQIKRLQDLAKYINQDYTTGTYDKQEEKLLFCGIHSSLSKQAEIQQQLGERVLKIQQNQSQYLNGKSKGNYFWQRTSKLLSSPAKVKEGLELTGGALAMFGLGDNKRN